MRVNSSYSRTLLDVFVVVEESDLAESVKKLWRKINQSLADPQAAPLVSPVYERFFPSADRISKGSLFKNVSVGV